MPRNANKALIEAAFAALSHGDGRQFTALMADDFAWHMSGTTPWSGTYRGKAAVAKMLAELFTQFTTTYRLKPLRILGDGDFIVVEGKGDVMTMREVAYNNDYCYVIRMHGGKMTELTEYFDTALVEAALNPPGVL
jgi:uncharacterized protein (TIGR02246 family)